MMHIIDSAVAAMTLHADTVRILADISSDGTSNGSIISIVRKVVAAVAVIGGAGFAVHGLRVQMAKEPGKTKNLMEEAKSFALFEGLMAVVWVIAEVAANVFGGAAS
jgi:hypothetical protein